MYGYYLWEQGIGIYPGYNMVVCNLKEGIVYLQDVLVVGVEGKEMMISQWGPSKESQRLVDKINVVNTKRN